jgi:hypothetical protein
MKKEGFRIVQLNKNFVFIGVKHRRYLEYPQVMYDRITAFNIKSERYIIVFTF